MASIIERGNSCSVVYYVNGKARWEACTSKETAKKRKVEIEYQQSKGTFVPPSIMTVADLMEQFIDTYGKTKWGYGYYEANVGLINNYILPHIGDWALKNCTTKKMTEYFNKLRETEAVQQPGRKAPPTLVSERNIYEIYGLLHIAFRLAVEWEEIGKHPLTKSMKPSSTRGTRESWDDEMAIKAIVNCTDFRLLMYFHFALGCSMRIGEISGLTWDRIFFDEENDFENAYLKVESQLSRISLKAYEDLKRKKGSIHFVFPNVYQNKDYKTLLVLKEPKTKSSIRTICIPQATAWLLHHWKKYQEQLKESLGPEEYQEFNLVMTQDNGRPIEASLIGEELDELIIANGLPDVDFHSLRHTSTSVKLVITGGDIKAVQDANGHATPYMTVQTYAKALDKQKKLLAEKTNDKFFANTLLPTFLRDFIGQEEYDNYSAKASSPIIHPKKYSDEELESIIDALLADPRANAMIMNKAHRISA